MTEVGTPARSGWTRCENTSLVSQSGCFDESQAEHASAWRRRDATCLARASGLRAAIRPIRAASPRRSVAPSIVRGPPFLPLRLLPALDFGPGGALGFVRLCARVIIFSMKTAVCDQEAFYPLRNLVEGPFRSVEDLTIIERLLRAVVLHDEIVMEFTPLPYDEDTETTDEHGHRYNIVALGPVLTGYDFFSIHSGPRPAVPNLDLSADLLQVASTFANAGEGNAFFRAHVDHLKRVLAVAEQGGSVVLESDFCRHAIARVEQYPEALFRNLDQEWQNYAQQMQEDGLRLLVPPVLGIVLTRCARRDAIPAVISDLRNEWTDARLKVWELLDSLRCCRSLREAVEIRNELARASRLFSPETSEADTAPIRALWEVLGGAVAGAVTGTLLGGNPLIGAATGAVGHGVRTLPGIAREFGPVLFGRGALDLAKRVRGGAAKTELDALPALLSDAERRDLGLC
jgi:hypothetical protein